MNRYDRGFEVRRRAELGRRFPVRQGELEVLYREALEAKTRIVRTGRICRLVPVAGWWEESIY